MKINILTKFRLQAFILKTEKQKLKKKWKNKIKKKLKKKIKKKIKKKEFKKFLKIAYKNIEKLNRFKVDTLSNADKLKSNNTA